MLRWSIAFLVLSIIAAVFGFTGIAAAFSDIGRILFFAFLILFAIALVAGLITPHSAAIGARARTLGLVTAAVLVGMGIYAWIDHDMSAERVGRAVDTSVARAGEEAVVTIESVADRAAEATRETIAEIRADAADAADRTEKAVEPEEEQRAEAN